MLFATEQYRLFNKKILSLQNEKQPFCCGLDSSNSASAVKNYNEGEN